MPADALANAPAVACDQPIAPAIARDQPIAPAVACDLPIADALPAMIAYWDRDLRCRFANRAYIDWFGKDPERLIGTHIRDLLGARVFALNEPHMRAALAGEPRNFERALIKPDGSIGHTWANYIPDIDENGVVAGFHVLVSDLTALKRAEPARPRASAESLGAPRHVAADDTVYTEGDPASLFFKILSGTVRTCAHLDDGGRQIDAFYGPGDLFGFETTPRHRHTAEAVTDTALIPYRREDLEAMPGLLVQMMRDLERGRAHMVLLGRCTAAQKLATFLLDMDCSAASPGAFDLPMGRPDIADYLGLTVETISRVLGQFERDGLIDLPAPRRVRLLDREAFRKQALAF